MLARVCEPSLQDLIEEAAEPQMVLLFGDTKPNEEKLGEFISASDFAMLPKGHQKMVQQAVDLYFYSVNKPGQSLAPVLTPLLGPIDEASKTLMLKRLDAAMPTERAALQSFFEPDMSKLPKKEADMFKRRGSDLKRTLVDHNGMSPIGLLRWCIQHARESKISAGGVFDAVTKAFGSTPDESYKLVSRINSFRNDYIAHQTKELSDGTLSKSALTEWIDGLVMLWGMQR